jgi:ATP-dependent DNA ligase
MIKYYYPQKPKLISIRQPLFSQLDLDKDTIAELKINGTHLILFRFSDGRYEFWNRHGEKLQYIPSKELIGKLNSLHWEGDCLLDGELEHTKVHIRKHTIMLHDIMIWDGVLLQNETFAERRKLLESMFYLCINPSTLESMFPDTWKTGDYEKVREIKDNVYPSIQWNSGYQGLFDKYTKLEEVEGLVIKKLSAKLKVGMHDCPEVSTMFKVRRAHKNYRF